MDFDIPSGRDGFLATNSLLATSIIAARAYRSFASPVDQFPATYRDFLAESLTPQGLRAANSITVNQAGEIEGLF